MSDAELNLWIAEKIEPKRSFAMTGRMTMAELTSMICQKKCWTEVRGDRSPYDTKFWQPRDFCTDPACTVMLMERLLRANDLTVARRPMFTEPTEGSVHVISGNYIGQSQQLGRAVAEAFVLANGLDAGRLK